MNEPRIAVESREHYHGEQGFFHLGHFRVVEYDFPGKPSQVIHEEFACPRIEVGGMASIHCEGLSLRRGLRARVPKEYLSQTSYALAMAEALRLSKQTGHRVEVNVPNIRRFFLEEVASR